MNKSQQTRALADGFLKAYKQDKEAQCESDKSLESLFNRLDELMEERHEQGQR